MRAAAAIRTRVALELVVVGVLAAWFVGTYTDRPSYVDVSAAFLAVGLIGLSAWRSRGVWQQELVPAADRGVRLRKAFHSVALFTVLVLALFLVAGVWLGYRNGGWTGSLERVANWHLIAAATLYFPWALLQQFIFQYYLLGRLLVLVPPWLALAATALAFSAVHFPRTPVMVGTAVAGLVWAAHYRRYRLLLPLAVSHALLGATMHYWVFGNDLLDRWLFGG